MQVFVAHYSSWFMQSFIYKLVEKSIGGRPNNNVFRLVCGPGLICHC